MATTISQGSNADLTLTSGQSVLLDNALSSKAVMEAVSGVAGSSYRAILAENHKGRKVYGPFETGVVRVGAVVGSVDYTVGTSEDFDNGNGFVGPFTGTGSSVPVGGTTGQALTTASDNDGDVEWSTVAGSGDVAKVGTPANNQVGVWTGDGTLEGDAALTFDTSTDTLAIAASGNLAFGAVTILDDNAGTMTLQNIDALDATTEATIEAAIDTLANLTSIQGQTITLTGAFVRSGAHSLTITTSGTTSVTFPTSGTLATVNGALGTPTVTTINGLTLTTSTGTITITNGKTLSVSNTLTFTGTDASSVAFGTGGTVAYANATVTLSSNTNLDRATHGNRLIIADTGGVTLTILDDTAGSWGSGDAIYGINTSTGVVTIAADATGTTTTVTASPGMTLSVPPGQEFSFSRTAANVWRGGASDTGLQQNSQSTAYTTVWADRGKQILHPTADNNARTFTIDSNANVPYPIGTTITFINQINTVTIAITSDTLTLAGAGTTGSRTLAANGIATAIKVSSTGWLINGTGLT
jgi:hypothetical protein